MHLSINIGKEKYEKWGIIERSLTIGTFLLLFATFFVAYMQYNASITPLISVDTAFTQSGTLIIKNIGGGSAQNITAIVLSNKNNKETKLINFLPGLVGGELESMIVFPGLDFQTIMDNKLFLNDIYGVCFKYYDINSHEYVIFQNIIGNKGYTINKTYGKNEDDLKKCEIFFKESKKMLP